MNLSFKISSTVVYVVWYLSIALAHLFHVLDNYILENSCSEKGVIMSVNGLGIEMHLGDSRFLQLDLLSARKSDSYKSVTSPF